MSALWVIYFLGVVLTGTFFATVLADAPEIDEVPAWLKFTFAALGTALWPVSWAAMIGYRVGVRP